MLQKYFVMLMFGVAAWASYLLLRWRNRRSGNRFARPGTVFVCHICGKRSRDKHGTQALNHGWDTSCMTWAELCDETTLVIGPDGLVQKATAA